MIPSLLNSNFDGCNCRNRIPLSKISTGEPKPTSLDAIGDDTCPGSWHLCIMHRKVPYFSARSLATWPSLGWHFLQVELTCDKPISSNDLVTMRLLCIGNKLKSACLIGILNIFWTLTWHKLTWHKHTFSKEKGRKRVTSSLYSDAPHDGSNSI